MENTVIYGEKSDKIYIYVPGQGGNKEEAERFYLVAKKYGYQVLGIDLPQNGADFFAAISFIKEIYNFAKENWQHIALRAVSIGAWFSLMALKDEKPENCLFSSPLLDMNRMICSLMAASRVTEEQLEKERIIRTDFGQTLNWDYLVFARENPVRACGKTAVFYASGDELIPKSEIDDFANNNFCRLTVYDGGEHWIHKENDLRIMEEWEENEIENFTD